MRQKVKDWGLPVLMTLLVSAFPAIFLYFRNAGEADFSEVLFPLAVFCAMGLCGFFISWLLTRSKEKAALIAGLFMLVFSNFSSLEAGLKLLFPSLLYWHTLPIIIVVFLELALLLDIFLSEEVGRMADGVVCLVFAALTLINIVTGMPALIGKIQTDRQLAAGSSSEIEQGTAPGESPNVYLLLFDEYANFQEMEEWLHYDNAVLKDYLTENHFTISYNSHNESIYTTTVMTNLMNLDYLVDDSVSSGEKALLRKQGALYTEMRRHGYDVQVVEAQCFLSDESPVTSAAGSATTASGEDLAYLLFSKTAIYPFYQIDTSSVLQSILTMESYLKSDALIPDTPTFTVAYLCFPHAPFVADEDGNPLPSQYYYDWSYYLGQYKYATKIMMKTIDNILQHDRDSIIILQSDHGARGIPISLELKNNPLNAVYYRGEPIDEIKDLSSVNTLRRVLSHLFGEEYELLTVPPCEVIYER